jgi:hypothetical protein
VKARAGRGAGAVPALAMADRDPWQAGTTPQSFAPRPGGCASTTSPRPPTRCRRPTPTAAACPTSSRRRPAAATSRWRRSRRWASARRAADGTLGGDDRLDLYLRDLNGADGSFAADTCTQTPFTCAGHVTIENDFVGYGYPSIVAGAARPDQPRAVPRGAERLRRRSADQWSEGSRCGPRRRCSPSRTTSSTWSPRSRPSRSGRSIAPAPGSAICTRTAPGCGRTSSRPTSAPASPPRPGPAARTTGSDPPFLTAIDAELTARGRRSTDAWIEFTRWNARTGQLRRRHRLPRRRPAGGGAARAADRRAGPGHRDRRGLLGALPADHRRRRVVADRDHPSGRTRSRCAPSTATRRSRASPDGVAALTHTFDVAPDRRAGRPRGDRHQRDPRRHPAGDHGRDRAVHAAAARRRRRLWLRRGDVAVARRPRGRRAGADRARPPSPPPLAASVQARRRVLGITGGWSGRRGRGRAAARRRRPSRRRRGRGRPARPSQAARR